MFFGASRLKPKRANQSLINIHNTKRPFDENWLLHHVIYGAVCGFYPKHRTNGWRKKEEKTCDTQSKDQQERKRKSKSVTQQTAKQKAAQKEPMILLIPDCP